MRAPPPRPCGKSIGAEVYSTGNIVPSGLVIFAEEKMAATGTNRRRRSLMWGPAALTPSEHRVAALAAGGLSNPDIARRLFVSRKTVEMHLANAYRQLDINSRQQLRSVLSPSRL